MIVSGGFACHQIFSTFLQDFKGHHWEESFPASIHHSHKTNQHFQYIPFNNFLQKIKYKADLAGIEVIFTEEAYTSKCSFLDRDALPKYKEGEAQPSGKRVKRGLYRSKNGTLLNADVNAGNIGRKVIPNSVFDSQWDRSLAARPIVVNPLNNSLRITAENGLTA